MVHSDKIWLGLGEDGKAAGSLATDADGLVNPIHLLVSLFGLRVTWLIEQPTIAKFQIATRRGFKAEVQERCHSIREDRLSSSNIQIHQPSCLPKSEV